MAASSSSSSSSSSAAFHSVTSGHTVFEVPLRYSEVEYLGAGAFSTVAKALDGRTRRRVTIKKLARPLHNEQLAVRCYRELRLLSQVRHPCVISLLDAFSPQLAAGQQLLDVYVVTQLLACDLRQLLLERGRLAEMHAAPLAQQLLHGVAYLHSGGVLHRDLKPANVGIGADCRLKILDFGLAREAAGGLSGYVFTRQYRSPELLLRGSVGCAPPADVWAVGCIVGEMLRGVALFPGSGQLEMVRLICERLGRPSPETLAKFENVDAEQFISELAVPRDAGCRSLLRHSACRTAAMLDFVRQLLQFDPDRRPTAELALLLPVFREITDSPQQRQRAAAPIVCEPDRCDLDLSQWKQEVADLLLRLPQADAHC